MLLFSLSAKYYFSFRFPIDLEVIQKYVDWFPNIWLYSRDFLLLISDSIPLSQHILYDLNTFKFICTCFMAQLWSKLVNILCAFLKNKYTFLVQQILIRSNWLIVLKLYWFSIRFVSYWEVDVKSLTVIATLSIFFF